MYVPLQLLGVLCAVHIAQGQSEDVATETCYGGGTIALSVILTLILGCLLAALVYFLWNKYWKARKGQHLFLETDPEKGKGEYAFDNPGFRDAGLSPIGKSAEKAGSKLESNLKAKWNQWSPLGALTTKNEKKRTLDDSELEHQIKNVSLRSHDFAGLGFNICGNMKDGIFIKDILHRGPASESKKLNAGDRIQSVTISFEHMVYEDALAILSYASPYEIIVSAKNGKAFNYSGQVGRPLHPVYRSSSNMELHLMEKSAKKKLFDDSSDFGSNYSSLQKNHNSMVPSLERSRSKSPKPVMKTTQKMKIDMPVENKEQMRPKAPRKMETEMQNTESKVHKFGIQVLPLESPTKSAETQNVNNVNHENELVTPIRSIDEVDKFKVIDNQLHFENETRPVKQQAPPVKKREKVPQLHTQQTSQPKPQIDSKEEEEILQRHNSGIRRDENNIPLEIPSTMMNAAVAARKNRKSMEEEELKSPKKKGKAPAPPEANQENKTNDTLKGDLKGYNSDSDIEVDNQSSVNTIELNASDITIHQSEDSDEKQNRKTASTGDLSKIQKTRKTSTGTLERAQSLDITDPCMPTLSAKKRKVGKCEEFESKTSSDESLYGSSLVNKEPRLSLILDGLNTFQRSRLKKSTEWGNLEDAILNLDKQGSYGSTNQNSSEENFKISNENFDKNFNFDAKSPEFDALVNKINEIKQETMDIIKEQDKHIKEVEISKEEISHIIENVKNGMESDLICSDDVSLKIEDEPMPQIIQTVEEFEISEEPIMTTPKQNKNIIWPFKGEKTHEIKLDDTIQKEDINTTKKMIITDITPISVVPNSMGQVSKPMVSEIEINMKPNTPPPTKVMNAEPIKVNEPKIVNVNEKDRLPVVNLAQVTDFLQAERDASAKYVPEIVKHEDTNIPDDIKVSRHTFGSTEKPISDKNVKNVHVSNVSNITINHQPKYEDANGKSTEEENLYKGFSITTPDLIKNLTIAEVIHDVNNEVTIDGPTSLTLEISNANATSDDNKIEIKQQNGIQMKANGDINKLEVAAPNELDDNRHSSLTYITEIQVTTPQKEKITPHREVEIADTQEEKLDNDFEHYIKKFENNIKTFENNINNFEANIQSIAENINTTTIEPPPKEIIPNSTVTMVTEVVNVDPEKELQKVHEIVEEQLKRLPEMRFTTSTYESHIKPPEKRMSQIEILRSNFEKSNSPPRHIRSEASPPKSRIPVLNKTPPTSPERRDSHADNEQATKEILEMMASRIPSKSKNVTVTSIRNNSRIPSGLPTYGNKPPVPPKKSDSIDDIVHVSANGGSGNVESFRQWVFNPNDQSITNITVTESKYDSSIHK